MTKKFPFLSTRPRAGIWPAGPRWMVRRVQFSWVHLAFSGPKPWQRPSLVQNRDERGSQTSFQMFRFLSESHIWWIQRILGGLESSWVMFVVVIVLFFLFLFFWGGVLNCSEQVFCVKVSQNCGQWFWPCTGNDSETCDQKRLVFH